MIISIPDTIKGVGVRFFANPELGRFEAETEEMCRRTIEVLEWLRSRRPHIVLVADYANKDPHAVQMRAMGRAVGYVDKDVAPLVRGMLKASAPGMLITEVTEVNVSRHGFFFVKFPRVAGAFEAEEAGVDWSSWTCEAPIVLPDECFMAEDELNFVIREVLLPNLREPDTEQLCEYFDLWMRCIRFNQSREVSQSLEAYIPILAADEREEVRAISRELDHLRTKRGSPEVITELVSTWWEPMLASTAVCDNYALLRLRALGQAKSLLGILDYVERLMRTMPGELYRDVGDAREFFSHLHYLAPPTCALRGILSLLAIRTLICRELGLGLEPCFSSRTPEPLDLERMPTTIGRVMAFNRDQCLSHDETVTLQRLVEWLERDSRGCREAEIESMLDAHKPQPQQVFEIKNNYAEGSCLFQAGSSQNGDITLDSKKGNNQTQ